MKTYKQILEGIDAIAFPKKINKSAITIIKKFCRYTLSVLMKAMSELCAYSFYLITKILSLFRDVPSDRLGFGNTGYRDIQKQRWYSGFNWEGLRNGNMKPPIMPEVGWACDNSLQSNQNKLLDSNIILFIDKGLELNERFYGCGEWL